MEKMGSAEPNFEEFFEEKKRVRNPLVPVGNSDFEFSTFPFLFFIFFAEYFFFPLNSMFLI